VRAIVFQFQKKYRPTSTEITLNRPRLDLKIADMRSSCHKNYLMRYEMHIIQYTTARSSTTVLTNVRRTVGQPLTH